MTKVTGVSGEPPNTGFTLDTEAPGSKTMKIASLTPDLYFSALVKSDLLLCCCLHTSVLCS